MLTSRDECPKKWLIKSTEELSADTLRALDQKMADVGEQGQVTVSHIRIRANRCPNDGSYSAIVYAPTSDLIKAVLAEAKQSFPGGSWSQPEFLG